MSGAGVRCRGGTDRPGGTVGSTTVIARSSRVAAGAHRRLRPGPVVTATVLVLCALLVLTAQGVAPAAAQEPGEVEDVLAPDAGYEVRSSVRATGDIAPDVRISGQGWGHGVGMSQIGAHAQALAGRDAEQILTHYYSGTQITTDTRASEQRIRAGIVTDVEASPIRALDAELSWQLCSPPESAAGNGRVDAERCAEWFTQAAGEQLRVRPLPTSGVTTPNGVQTHAGDDVTTLVAVGEPDEVVPAPDGGILIQRRVGESWQAHRAYVTPDDGRGAAQLPVARALHGTERIAAQTYQGDSGAPDGERNYAHGWRDFHLTTAVADGEVSYALTVVQDVDSIEQYLQGLDEVPSSWPAAALEVQVITGRTYALRSGIGGACRCDILSTARSQVFRGISKVEGFAGEQWLAAIEATTDQVLTYEGQLAETYYSSSFGGRSENLEDSWAYYRAYQDLDRRQPAPYLRSVDDPWSLLEEIGGQAVSNSRRNWTAVASNQELTRLVNLERRHLGLSGYERIERIRLGERTQGGTALTLLVSGTTSGGDREDMTFRGIRTSDGRTLTRPIAGATLRLELTVRETVESNQRLSSSQLTGIGFGPFDDDDGSTHEYSITWAAQAGIVQGISATDFEPGEPVTRAQMATFLDNTFDLPAPAAGASTFPDVPPGSTHHTAVEAVAAAGITTGYRDGTYRPGAPLSRQEMATLLARAQGLIATYDHSFTDIEVDGTHGPSVSAVAEAGITTGCGSGRFCPEDPVTRGQLASFVRRSVRR